MGIGSGSFDGNYRNDMGRIPGMGNRMGNEMGMLEWDGRNGNLELISAHL